MSDEPPTCDRDGCTDPSEYLLTCGDRCGRHAAEDQPEVVRYLKYASAAFGVNSP